MSKRSHEPQDETPLDRPPTLPLTGKQAAKMMKTSLRVAQRCIQTAAANGDPHVARVGDVWVASERWWRAHLKHRGPGRPPKGLARATEQERNSSDGNG